jgi:hypothetical protein
MEPTPFELTPEQKGLLESLARETGKAIPSLLDEALEGLQEHVRHRRVNGDPHGSTEANAAPQPHEAQKPIWEIAEELFGDIPDEELERLPPDGATQHDHYIYGLPKRPT